LAQEHLVQNSVRLSLLVAIIVQSASIGHAQSTRRATGDPDIARISPELLEKAGILTDKVTMDRPSLLLLGELLADFLLVPSNAAIAMGLYSDNGQPVIKKTESISTAQLLALLVELPERENPKLWESLSELPDAIQKLAKKNSIQKIDTIAGIKMVLAAARKSADKTIGGIDSFFSGLTPKQKSSLKAFISPEKPFGINVRNGVVVQAGYEKIRMYVNHTQVNPKYLYDGKGHPTPISDQEFAKHCEKILPSEALAGKRSPIFPYSIFVPGMDFAFACAEKDYLVPGTSLVRVLRSFISGTSELAGSLPHEGSEQIQKDLTDLGLQNGAANEVWFNVFEFDLDEVKNAFIKNHDRNLKAYIKAGKFDQPIPKLRGGIDHDYIEGGAHPSPLVTAIYNEFKAYAAQVAANANAPALKDLPEVRKAFQESVQVFSVVAPKLNHQKIVIRDPNDAEKAAVLFLSGNFTQSCLGPYGDLSVSEVKRGAIKSGNLRVMDLLEDALPNANHAIILKGHFAAQVTRLELMKFLKPNAETSKDSVPVVGSYRIYRDAGPVQKSPFIDITFSVNGGLGTPDRDVLVPLIQAEADRVAKGGKAFVESIHFVMSSENVGNALLRLAAQSTQNAGGYDFRFVGDSQFAMREYSVIQKLSCVTRRNEKNGNAWIPKEFYDLGNPRLTRADYFKNLPANLRDISKLELEVCPSLTPISYLDGNSIRKAIPIPWEKGNLKGVRQGLRIAPKAYGNHSIPGEDGKVKLAYESKIHHKVLVFPNLNMGTLGSSFNPSASANDNHEQLLIIKDVDAVDKMRGAIAFMYAFSPISRAGQAAPACGGVHDGSVFCESLERNRRATTLTEDCSEASIRLIKDLKERKARKDECNEIQDEGDNDSEK
jgi:hypothetical protein